MKDMLDDELELESAVEKKLTPKERKKENLRAFFERNPHKKEEYRKKYREERGKKRKEKEYVCKCGQIYVSFPMRGPRLCPECRSLTEYERTKKLNPERHEKEMKQSWEYAKKHPREAFSRALTDIKARVKRDKKKRPLLLTDEELRTMYNSHDVSQLSSIPFDHYATRDDLGDKYKYPYRKSFDRVDSSKGYVHGNVILICSFENILKGHMPMDLVNAMCLGVAKKILN